MLTCLSSDASVIRLVRDGVVTSLAGNGSHGSTDGKGTSASFYVPAGLAVSRNNILYVADYGASLTGHLARVAFPLGHSRARTLTRYCQETTRYGWCCLTVRSPTSPRPTRKS